MRQYAAILDAVCKKGNQMVDFNKKMPSWLWLLIMVVLFWPAIMASFYLIVHALVFLAILGVLLLIGAAVEWYSKRSGSNK